MKKYLFIVLLVGVGFGQDFLITLDGREFPGKYISHNETTVNFQRKDSKGTSSFSIDSIKGVRTANGQMVRLEIPNDIVSTITFKNGMIKTGYIESFSLEDRSDNGKINFKEKISHNYLGYDKNSISLIKSWNEKRLFPFGVIANKETGKYHLSNVRHRPTDDNAIFYDSEIDAEKNKFSSCHACFDNSPMIDDYRLEKA